MDHGLNVVGWDPKSGWLARSILGFGIVSRVARPDQTRPQPTSHLARASERCPQL